MSRIFFFLSLICLCLSCGKNTTEPDPVLPIPSERQLRWQEMEYYGFIHFNMNTFNNMEWGFGDTPAETFNPTELDTRQWAKVAKDAGMKGIIITAKHHDGFCLWPSKYTEYSIKNSPYKNGNGDIIQELADACQEYGLKMGIYLSPWDRNHADYGRPEYIQYFRNQLEELLTNYGDIFEVWFDGANGGDGFYGGANETRKVDKKTYYDWANTVKIIRALQPDAVIFGDAGPDVRWVGNEHGYAYKTTWSPLLRDSVYGGMPEYASKYAKGQEHGTHWVPAEADVSIRPGWYYHTNEDDKVKSLEKLLDIYYRSVGLNSTLLLNLPVDNRGLVHENDVRQLKKLTEQLKLDFQENLAFNQPITATNTRGNASRFSATKALDNDKNTYWATDNKVTQASLSLEFDNAITFNRLLIQEYIPLGQRIKKFSIEAFIDDAWKVIANETTIGYKRILRLNDITTNQIRINIEDAKASPTISNIEVYQAPLIIDAPAISRNKNGKITMYNPSKGVDIFYTTNGETPTMESAKYDSSIDMPDAGIVKAFTYDPHSKRKSEIAKRTFDISKKLWKIKHHNGLTLSDNAIDDDPYTNWDISYNALGGTYLDLGKKENLKGITFTPDQRRWTSGVITHYSILGSNNETYWYNLASGEFSNIVANPIKQTVNFKETHSVRYLKFLANKIMNYQEKAVIAEIGVITK